MANSDKIAMGKDLGNLKFKRFAGFWHKSGIPHSRKALCGFQLASLCNSNRDAFRVTSRLGLKNFSDGVDRRSRIDLLVLVPELRYLKEGIYAIPFQTVKLKASCPVLGINTTHRKAHSKTQIRWPR